MVDFLKAQFDKLLLVALILIYAWTAVHGSAYSQRVSDVVLGALITLITGKAVAAVSEPPK